MICEHCVFKVFIGFATYPISHWDALLRKRENSSGNHISKCQMNFGTGVK